jgi:hypothetical protein
MKVSEIFQTIKQLIDVRIQLILDRLQETFSAILNKIIILVVMVIAGLQVLLFGSIALAFYLSELAYSTFMGFLYVALIYLVILIILFFVRNSIDVSSKIQKFFRAFVVKNPK